MRSDKCPFMETKTFCSNCKVHCYKPVMWEKIREVMRFSGPRMLFSHPVMAVSHVIESKKEKTTGGIKVKIKKLFICDFRLYRFGSRAVGAVLPLLPAFPFCFWRRFALPKALKTAPLVYGNKAV